MNFAKNEFVVSPFFYSFDRRPWLYVLPPILAFPPFGPMSVLVSAMPRLAGDTGGALTSGSSIVLSMASFGPWNGSLSIASGCAGRVRGSLFIHFSTSFQEYCKDLLSLLALKFSAEFVCPGDAFTATCVPDDDFGPSSLLIIHPKKCGIQKYSPTTIIIPRTMAFFG